MKSKIQYIKAAFLFALPLSLLVVGCENKGGSSVDVASVASPTNDAGAAVADANNSRKNVRDRDNATATPGDQSGAPADLKTTQIIRQALVSGTNGYSTAARNIKIILKRATTVL